jgi:hypothetical protein
VVSPAFPEQQFQQQLGARVRPQPSGLVPQQQEMDFAVQQFNQMQPSAQELGGQVSPIGKGVLDFFGGLGGGVADIGRRFVSPETSPFTGQNLQPYNPMFQPESMMGQFGRGIVSGITGGYPEGPIDHRSLSGPEQALMFADLVDPSGVGGDILRPLAKAIPEGALAGGFLGGWFMPKNIKNTKAVSRLEDMWKHPVFTRDKWAPNPSVEEIRTIGAQSLYLDDVTSGIKNTSPQTYMNMGRGNQTMEQAIRRATSDPFRGSPGSLQKQSDEFNRMAIELRGPKNERPTVGTTLRMEDTLEWVYEKQDYLEDIFGFNPLLSFSGPVGGPHGFGDPKAIAKEFDRIAKELKEEAQASQKWIDTRTNQVIDEETKIMERGLKEYTGKGTVGGGSGTIPPQGAGGVLPNAPIPPKGQRLIDMHIKGGFPEKLTDKQIAQELWLRTPEGQQYRELWNLKQSVGILMPNEKKEIDKLTDIYLEQGLSLDELKAWRKQMRQDAAEDAAMLRELDRDID